jgi:microcystin-dependent protein
MTHHERGRTAPTFDRPALPPAPPGAPWVNVGSVPVLHGCPIVRPYSGYSTGLSGGAFALAQPAQNSADKYWLNVGADVAVGARGAAIIPAGPFIGRVAQAVAAGNIVGIRSGNPTWVKTGTGYGCDFIVLAYLGKDADGWDIAQLAPYWDGNAVGTVKYTLGALLPGYLALDGSTFTVADYPRLNAYLGTNVLKDGRSRSPLGAGKGSGLTNRLLASTGGEENHALSSGENASHDHGMMLEDSGDVYAAGSDLSAVVSALGIYPMVTGPSGTGTAHNTMHPWLAMTGMIRY